MTNHNPRILVLSSVSPSQGPGIIGRQIYDALQLKGMEVDFMTKYPEPNHPEFLWVLRKNSCKDLYYRIKRRFRWLLVGGKPKETGYFFSYSYEKWPPISSREIVNAIKKDYDLVYVVFWQELLSFESIEQIYDKLHCQIIFGSVDYSPMSGGCHFTKACQGYKNGCGKCPAFHSDRDNDFTAKNIRYRKKVYEKVKPIVCGNHYMQQFYNQSYLLKDVRQSIGPAPIINTDIFRPIEKCIIRDKYQIPEWKKYIVFFGSQNLKEKRKGFDYLIDAFRFLFKMMEDETKNVLVITAGNNGDAIMSQISFDCRSFGYVSMDELPELYSLATCFVCPSINDAGPMMVNQSLCCGTPVVGFDMGAVKEVVKGQGSGICVPLKDSRALAEGILQVFKMTSEEYLKMSNRAREIALKTSSYDAQADFILSTYKKYMNQ